MIKTLNIAVPNALQHNGPIYDYSAFDSLEEFKSLAGDADVIILINESRAAEWHIAFGKTTLKSIVFGAKTMRKSIAKDGACRVLYLGMDMDKKPMEHALAAVQTVKGYHDYLTT